MHETKQQRFDRFHSENPQVYMKLVILAREWRERRGPNAKLGIAALFERYRWEIPDTTTDPDYKISNDHKPYYARLMMRQEADLADIFTLKSSAADRGL